MDFVSPFANVPRHVWLRLAAGCVAAVGVVAGPAVPVPPPGVADIASAARVTTQPELDQATLFRLTPAECLAGVTRNAARALGLHDRGVIAAGRRADLAVWDVRAPAELSYRIGFNPLHARVFGGVLA